MNFLPIFNPFTAGYLYGVTLSTTTTDIKEQVATSPILTTVNVLSTGCVYALTADLASKVVLPERGDKVLTAVLFGVAGYNIYKFFKDRKKKFAGDESSVYDQVNTVETTG